MWSYPLLRGNREKRHHQSNWILNLTTLGDCSEGHLGTIGNTTVQHLCNWQMIDLCCCCWNHQLLTSTSFWPAPAFLTSTSFLPAPAFYQHQLFATSSIAGSFCSLLECVRWRELSSLYIPLLLHSSLLLYEKNWTEESSTVRRQEIDSCLDQ